MEACPSQKVLFPMFIWYYYYLLLSSLPWQWLSITLTLYHKIYELFYLWCQTNLKLQEKLCNKCPSGNSSETAVIVTFLVRSLALHRTTEPQEALWHFNGILIPKSSTFWGYRQLTFYPCNVLWDDIQEKLNYPSILAKMENHRQYMISIQSKPSKTDFAVALPSNHKVILKLDTDLISIIFESSHIWETISRCEIATITLYLFKIVVSYVRYVSFSSFCLLSTVLMYFTNQ